MDLALEGDVRQGIDLDLTRFAPHQQQLIRAAYGAHKVGGGLEVELGLGVLSHPGGIRGCCVYGSIGEEEVEEQHLGCGWKGGCAAC